MTRIAPPLLGYNNNVRYLGRTFHIQTEDSGTKYARIMTHLFIDGGHIVKSTRTEYGSVIGQADMAETVRRMMKEQHKNMFLSLRAGEFDELIDRVVNGGPSLPPAEPVLSRVPRLSPDPLPSLSFGAGDEAKTMPGMSTLVIDSTAAPPMAQSTPCAPEAHAQQPPSASPKRESTRLRSVRPVSNAVGPDREHSAQPVMEQSAALSESPDAAARRSSGRLRKSPRRGSSAEEPAAAATPEDIGEGPSERSSEQPSRTLPVRPPTITPEVIDPRSQSIFGEATAGRQTLDEVILSFLEDDES